MTFINSNKIIHNDNYYYDVVRINIRKYRLEKGYPQQKLAEEAEMALDYLAEIESLKCEKSFSIAILGRIADVLEVSICSFLLNKYIVYLFLIL